MCTAKGQSKDAKMERSEFSVIDGDHSYLQRQVGGPTPNATNSSGVEEGCGSALITGAKLCHIVHTQHGAGFFRILCTFKQSHISRS